MDYLRGFTTALGGKGEASDGPTGAETVLFYFTLRLSRTSLGLHNNKKKSRFQNNEEKSL